MAKEFRVVSICMTDIWEYAKKAHSALSRSEKNGKVYASLLIGDKDEKDKYGQDVYVKLNPQKDKKETEGSDFVGNGKIMEAKSQAPQASDIPSSDDQYLPF
mgnify:CR=1 FL=1